MKFVGPSASIFTCFESDFESIIATLTKINNEESVGLLENILRVEFVLDFLFIKDIMSHLSKCSKDVQISCSLPWDFPNEINSFLNTLEACNDILKTKDDLSDLNKQLFPGFSDCVEIISKKVFKNNPLLNVPISTPLTNQRNVNVDCDAFIDGQIEKYKEYLYALIDNLKKRFLSDGSTYQVCQKLGELLNFSWLLNPAIVCSKTITDMETVTCEDFSNIVEKTNFAPENENEIAQLFFNTKFFGSLLLI